MFDEYYQGKLNNTKGCEEDDRNDGQDDPQEEETRFFLWITGDSRYAICIAPTIFYWIYTNTRNNTLENKWCSEII